MRFLSSRIFGLLAGIAAVTASADSIEGNFQATFLTYDRPDRSPEVAYSVLAGGNYYYPTSAEVADDIELEDGSGIIAGIRFEYYANYAQASGLLFRVYGKDRQGNPGELLHTQAIDVRLDGAVVNVSFAYNVANVLPEEFFFSVQFPAATGSQKAGPIVADRKPSVGDSDDKLLIRQGDAWKELELRDTPQRVKVSREGKKLRFALKEDRRKRVRVERSQRLDVGWTAVGETETDDNGDGEFLADEDDSSDVLFFRTVPQ